MTVGKHTKIAVTGSDISAQVSVGRYTSIASHVQMHSLTQHACIQDRNLVSTAQLPGYPPTHSEEKIIIGSDVWIGRNAVLLGNITIGDGAIIGAFSVVAKDVPPYAVVVGNPAQIKRYRFTEEQIKVLLKIQWWNMCDDEIIKLAPYLKNVDSLINYYEENPHNFV